MDHHQKNEYQEWVNTQMEEGDEWEDEMVELERRITAKLQCSVSKKEENYIPSNSVNLEFCRSSPNFETKENTIIIRNFQKACDYMAHFGVNIKQLTINAENLNLSEIGVLMQIVFHKCTELNSLNLMFFNHGFSSYIEQPVFYIINLRIHGCNFDNDTIMMLINSSEQIIIIN